MPSKRPEPFTPIPTRGIPLSAAISDADLDIVFRTARTYNAFKDIAVSPAILQAVYELVALGPTSANCEPGRYLFLASRSAKERLKPQLDGSNLEKTMKAPVTAIIAYDLDFAEKMPRLFPHRPNAKDNFKDPQVAQDTAFRNGSLQGAYFILAARSLGLDCGPMSGFKNAGVDKEFFAGTRIKSNFLCNLGYGDPASLSPRHPRLTFEEVCEIL
jgi:3-hydroxypropanoate dehydrogenase